MRHVVVQNIDSLEMQEINSFYDMSLLSFCQYCEFFNDKVDSHYLSCNKTMNSKLK